MNPRLVEEGWVHPADPGPGRRELLPIVVAGGLLLLAWGLLGTGWLGERFAPEPRKVIVAVAANGDVAVDGRRVEMELRERSGVAFLVGEVRVGGDERDPIDVRTRLADGIGAGQVVVRELRPHGTARDARLLVTVAVEALAQPPELPASIDSLPSLRDRTEPFDMRLIEVRDDRRLRDAMRDGWWWIAPLGLLVVAGAPLFAWRRMRRRTFDQRVPGPGRAADLAPPSSIDPVGAAILVAGARPPDDAAAFAGHVLDLVERRQLPVRRSATTPPGLGALVGMHHADEQDDVAVGLLAELVPPDESSLHLPDDLRAVPSLGAAARARWHDHVDGRAGFERLVDRAPVRRLRVAAAVLGVVSVAGAIAAVAWTLPGRSAVALLVAALAAIASATVAAWALDARRWRTVARGRRTERAQWIAWRSARSADPGATLDDRSLPVLVATGRDLPGVRAAATPDAIGLAAVTTRTVAALRATIDPPP